MCSNMAAQAAPPNSESDEVDELFSRFMSEVLVSLIPCTKFNVISTPNFVYLPKLRPQVFDYEIYC